MPLIECRNLTISFGGHPAVENLSFSVEQGDYLFILGENGSGKSTLVRALLGLLTPKSGEIIWDSGKIRPGEIGYLPQQTSVRRDFPASVSEVVLSGCAGRRGLRPFYNAADHARADRALESLDAQPLKKRPFSQLSGGQRQRVLLARALCAADGVLLLDEPVAALDPAASAEMYALIERLNRERGVTVLMVSHDLDAARRWARHVLAMKTESLYFGEAARYFEELSQPRGGNADA